MSSPFKETKSELTFDINDHDKSKFICIKFPDSSLYFGEVAYFDSEGTQVNP